MASKPPAFQFYVKDWLSSESVVVMTAEQRGWYVQLLCHAWNSEPIATLPADDRKLKALAGAAESWATEKQAVLDCFEVEGDRLVNRRLANQFKEMEEFRNSKSEAGRKGNEVRWNKNRNDIAQPSHSDESAIANHRPSTATASSTATSIRLSSAEGNRQQSAETRDIRSKALDPDLVKFWADNVSNYWPTAKVYNPGRAAEQCDSYLSSCGPAKRKAILSAWEKSKNGGSPSSEDSSDCAAAPDSKTNVGLQDPDYQWFLEAMKETPRLEHEKDCVAYPRRTDVVCNCGLYPAVWEGAQTGADYELKYATGTDDLELPKSKAFEIED